MAPWLLGLTGGLGVMVASSLAFDWPHVSKVAVETKVPVAIDKTPLARTTHFVTSFAPVVKKAAPSVVNISTTRLVKQKPAMDFFNDPMLRRFFGNQFGDHNGRPHSLWEHSLGSGVIVSKDGYILTNNHVVDGATQIKVTLANHKQTYDAKIVGRDPDTDLAVLKINAENLPAATFGDSHQVEVGDVVLAIGSPFGLSQTVTMGIVSAVDRGGMGIEDYENFIQTDAAINPGNSGGALVDMDGRVIGINTAILSRSGGNQGIGFAIPSDLACNIMERLIKYGKINRGYMGVMIQNLTPSLAQAFNVPNQRGALIAEVNPNSAAAAAGLKNGDVIIGFDGKPVTSSRELKLSVGELQPGATVPVKVLRQGKEMTFEVTLKSMPQQGISQTGEQENHAATSALKGVTVTDITSTARSQYNLPPDLTGALVTQVDESSAAYEAGLRPGDVIQQIDNTTIKNAGEAEAATQNLATKHILLRVYSHGASRYMVVNESNTK
ncbi:MAG: DegQ family serine endoprotease [Candidatus Omnitrophica bacterium]|nr:DegQ family serine endoprotease [Candidatus Omnitrophota bacterium]